MRVSIDGKEEKNLENEIDLDKLNDYVGMVAGLCVTMYRSAVDAGASTGEALGIVNAFFSALLDSKVTGEKDKDQAEKS